MRVSAESLPMMWVAPLAVTMPIVPTESLLGHPMFAHDAKVRVFVASKPRPRKGEARNDDADTDRDR